MISFSLIKSSFALIRGSNLLSASIIPHFETGGNDVTLLADATEEQGERELSDGFFSCVLTISRFLCIGGSAVIPS